MYAAVVVVVNITLIKLFNNWTGWGEALVILSVISFWIAFWTETNFEIFN